VGCEVELVCGGWWGGVMVWVGRRGGLFADFCSISLK